MTTDIKFSVTVPAYKAQFLAECIDSILVQTYKNFELIIVNDASPQDLDSIVKRYDDPRIHYYKNKVGFGAEHVVGNWNKCLEYATGDYVICMGDDDKLLPNCLEEYVKLIKQYPNLNLYHAMTLLIDEKSKVIGVQAPRPLHESVLSMIYYRWFGGIRSQYIGDWLFRTRHLKDIGGFVDVPCAWEADDISACKAAGNKGVANLQVPGFLYRVNSQTISNNNSNTGKKLEARLKVISLYKAFLKNVNTTEVTDSYYYQKIVSGIYKHLSDVQVSDLASDAYNNIFKLVVWYGKRKKYSITNKTLFRTLIRIINRKLRKTAKLV